MNLIQQRNYEKYLNYYKVYGINEQHKENENVIHVITAIILRLSPRSSNYFANLSA
jgi:hypothetical protein